MPLTITSTSLMKDRFTGPMDWASDVIGMNVTDVNVQIAATGGPASIDVDLATHCPNGKGGTTSLASPLRLSVPLFDAASGKYRLTKKVADVAPFLALDKTK